MYQTIHECEHDGVMHKVLHDSETGGYIKIAIPRPQAYLRFSFMGETIDP